MTFIIKNFEQSKLVIRPRFNVSFGLSEAGHEFRVILVSGLMEQHLNVIRNSQQSFLWLSVDVDVLQKQNQQQFSQSSCSSVFSGSGSHVTYKHNFLNNNKCNLPLAFLCVCLLLQHSGKTTQLYILKWQAGGWLKNNSK